MADALLKLPDVLARTGHSKSSWYAAIAKGQAPVARKRGTASLWIQSEIDAYVEAEKQRLPKMGPSMGRRRKDKKKPLESAA